MILKMILKMVFSVLWLPWIQLRVQMPCNFLGRCQRPVTLGSKGQMWQARSPHYPLPLPGPWGAQMPGSSDWLGSSGPSRPWLRHAGRRQLPHTGWRWLSLWPAGPCPGKGAPRLRRFRVMVKPLPPAGRRDLPPWRCGVPGLTCFLAQPLLVPF